MGQWVTYPAARVKRVDVLDVICDAREGHGDPTCERTVRAGGRGEIG